MENKREPKKETSKEAMKHMIELIKDRNFDLADRLACLNQILAYGQYGTDAKAVLEEAIRLTEHEIKHPTNDAKNG